MPLLFIGSTGDNAGQSILIWTIARRLLERGLSVGFIKPFGTNPVQVDGAWTDHDAYLFREVLGLHEPLERICPFLITDEAWRQRIPEEILQEFLSLAGELSSQKDVLLVMGSRHIFFDDAACPVSDVALVSELKADFLLITRHRKVSKSVYSILSVCSLLKERVKGIVLNRIPYPELDTIRENLIPSLLKKGIPLRGAIPEEPMLSYHNLREIMETLNGDLLVGEEGLDRPVGSMTVGAADLKGELLMFKRAYNKIILLQPAADLAGPDDAPSPRPVAGIILTAGRNPAPQLIGCAKRAKIPLLLVKDDSFTALERLEQSTSRLSPKDEMKVKFFTALMDRDGSLERLLRSLGFIP